MAVKTYDPKKIIVTYGGFILTGFADGTFVNAERNEDMWTVQIGTDGEDTRSKSNNRSGQITISLMQTSDSNQVLSAFALADESLSSSALPFQIKDINGNTLLIAESAWIKKIPAVEYSREAGPRDWVFETGVLVINIAGN